MDHPKGALLDVDGTLIDSNDAHARAWVEALAERGIAVDLDTVRRLIGKGSDKLLPELTGIEKESREGEEITARRTAIFLERHLPTLRPFPAARALLERMLSEGLSLTVATSANADELEALLGAADVQDLLPRRTSSDDADRSKPDPDIVKAALARAGLAAHEAVMLGDTPYDVEAAVRAKVAIVALRCGGWSDAELRGAVAVYDDPAELLERFATSPFARNA